MALNQQGYTSQILAGGTSDGRQATGEDFGAGIARGLDTLGRGVGAVADTALKIDQDQGNLWAATAVSQKELAIRQTLTDHVNALDPTAPDYAEQIKGVTEFAKTTVAQGQQELMDNAPVGSARRFVSYHMANAGLRIADGAMAVQSKLNADYTTGLVQQGMKADSDLVAASPDNDTFARLVQKTHDAVVGLNTIAPNVKADLLTTQVHALSTVQAYSVMSADPQSFLASVNLAGGVLHRGLQAGGVPTQAPGDPGVQQPPAKPQQPAMLAFANAQLAAGKSIDDAMLATTKQFPDLADKFSFVVPKGGTSFVDNGVPERSLDPQVQPLSDQAIADAAPPLAGWKNLGFDEKIQLVRQAEALVGKAAAGKRGSTEVQMQDALASCAAGKDYPDLANLKASNALYLNPAEAQRKNDQLDYAQGVGGFLAKVAVMPTAQATAYVQQHAPAGGDEFAVKQPVYEQAVAALANAQKQQQAAPIDYAIQHGIADAAPLDFSSAEKLGAGLRQRVAVNATMTRDFNTPNQIFSKPEVDALDQGVAKLPAREAVDYLGNVRASLGNTRDFATAMNQLGHKNPMLAYAGSMAVTGATVTVDGQPMAARDIAAKILDGDRILNGAALDTSKGVDTTMPAGSAAAKFNETQFRAAFDRALPPAAFQSPDAARSAGMQKDIYNAVKAYFVADAMQSGKPITQINDVNAAVQAVTGGTAPMGNGGVLMAPFGTPVEQFQAQWPGRMKQALAAAGHADDDIARNGDKLRPINLGDGRYGFLNGTRMLLDPHKLDARGKPLPVVIDYAQPYTGPSTAPDTSTNLPRFPSH
jgi:hypothetical protein